MLGCNADAHRAAAVLGGDEVAASAWMARLVWGQPMEMFAGLLRNLGAGAPPLRRAKIVATALAGMPGLYDLSQAHCEVARGMATELGCGAGVAAALGEAFERWDGKGMPGKRRREQIVVDSSTRRRPETRPSRRRFRIHRCAK